MSNVVHMPDRPEPDRSEGDSRSVRSGKVGRAVYTVAEVADLLSLSTGSTYRLIRQGHIPAMKLGARWVIPKRRFNEWLDSLPEASETEVEAAFEDVFRRQEAADR